MKFWNRVDSLENGMGEKKYPILTKLILAALTVPQSSASVKRLFSALNRLKDKDANRYLLMNATGRLLARQHVKRQGNCCLDYKPSK